MNYGGTNKVVDFKKEAEGIKDELVEIRRDLHEHPELGLKQTLQDQRRECNVEFSKFIEKNYKHWLDYSEDNPEG